MSNCYLENCSLYRESTKIKNTPIYIFDSHNLALPIWGMCCNQHSVPLNLVTLDYHTDTNVAFKHYLHNKLGRYTDFPQVGYLPDIAINILSNIHYKIDDFNFEDVLNIAQKYITNSEQILTAVNLGYLSSYTVITREESTSDDYERVDRLNGYCATYLSSETWAEFDFNSISDPIVLDFDLDFFGSIDDFNISLQERLIPLIKRAKVITIAREPHYFEYNKTDPHYQNDLALHQLLTLISEVL